MMDFFRGTYGKAGLLGFVFGTGIGLIGTSFGIPIFWALTSDLIFAAVCGAALAKS